MLLLSKATTPGAKVRSDYVKCELFLARHPRANAVRVPIPSTVVYRCSRYRSLLRYDTVLALPVTESSADKSAFFIGYVPVRLVPPKGRSGTLSSIIPVEIWHCHRTPPLSQYYTIIPAEVGGETFMANCLHW